MVLDRPAAAHWEPTGTGTARPLVSRISVAFTPPISRSKAHPPFLSDRKHGAELARSAKITMAAPQNPPFLDRVCFPPAENCSDRGAFCARRVEQQVVRAYPSSASGEHAVVCKCRANFIKIQGFENGAFSGPEHGTHHLPLKATHGEASHHQVLEGRTRKLEQSANSPPQRRRRLRLQSMISPQPNLH